MDRFRKVLSIAGLRYRARISEDASLPLSIRIMI